MPGVELPNGSIAIFGTSVIYAMGGRFNEKYKTLETYVTQRNISVRIPDHVAEELGESPEAYRYQRDRLRAAQDAWWPKRAEVGWVPRDEDEVISGHAREELLGLGAFEVGGVRRNDGVDVGREDCGGLDPGRDYDFDVDTSREMRQDELTEAISSVR